MLQRVAGRGLQAERLLKMPTMPQLQGEADVSTKHCLLFPALHVFAGLPLPLPLLHKWSHLTSVTVAEATSSPATTCRSRKEHTAVLNAHICFLLKAGAWCTSQRLLCLEAPTCNSLQQPLCSA